MPGPAIAEIWENTKDMGLLLGKGGFYGNVSIFPSVSVNICILYIHQVPLWVKHVWEDR